MPYTTIATNDVLTASMMNANWRDQVVSTVTSSTRPAGTQGQYIFETDTNRLYIYTGVAWELAYQQGGWQSYTPGIDQGATTNIAKTVVYAKFSQFGKTMHLRVNLSLTAAGTANSAVTVFLPTPAASFVGNDVIGQGFIHDASSGTPNIPCVVILASAGAVYFIDSTQATNVVLGQTGSAFAAALASGDTVTFSATFEIA
jgi:hypothetical protein